MEINNENTTSNNNNNEIDSKENVTNKIEDEEIIGEWHNGLKDIHIKESNLQNKYTFWYMKRGGSSKTESYEKSVKEIGAFDTIEGFWRIYNHLVRPNALPNTTDYHLFKTGIKPMWEDPRNRRGGKWMVRIRKGLASKYWEELILAIIGEQFNNDDICGAVMSIRYNEDIISLWSANADNKDSLYKLRDSMKAIIKLPDFVNLEYKRHDASLTDNSSFRNTSVWRPGHHSDQRHGHHHKRINHYNMNEGDKNSYKTSPNNNFKHLKHTDNHSSLSSKGNHTSGWKTTNNRKDRYVNKDETDSDGWQTQKIK